MMPPSTEEGVSVEKTNPFRSNVVLKAATGKARQVHVLMWIVAIVFAVYFAIEPLKTLFGID